jgi:hypothetical protein
LKKVLKQYRDEMKRTGKYDKAYEALCNANILKLLGERHPDADPKLTIADVVDATEMTEIVREAEAMTEAFMKSEIERMAREIYHRLMGDVLNEPPGRFLMTPAQHRQWARLVRKRGRPDLAFHHEQLARVIERLDSERPNTMPIRLPPLYVTR